MTIALFIGAGLLAWVAIALIVAPRLGRRLRRTQPSAPEEADRGDR